MENLQLHQCLCLFFHPKIDHVTLLSESEVAPVTVAIKSCVLPFTTLAVDGDTVTELTVALGVITVIVFVPLLLNYQTKNAVRL
ncbi:hypothetical protein ACS3UN_12285 [Oscillospiraceae bacterium LTW-04]|nr:hypothetical protein RBH76_14030 [Oscillospiraceae bacterium MB24-C1]WMJ83864.1 hypothetical protein RBH76_00085 [Oscillospiraceae bacterium MB24-C1]